MNDHWIRYMPEIAPSDFLICWAPDPDSVEPKLCVVYSSRKSPTGWYLFNGQPIAVKWFWTIPLPDEMPPQ